MTDKKIEEKFCSMATKFISERQIEGVIATIWNLEKIHDIGEVLNGLVFKWQAVMREESYFQRGQGV
jgi:hypothetical protein